MSTNIRTPPLADGEYDIDVSALLLDDKFEENFAIRYGFVPESIDDDLPFQLVKDTTTNTLNTTSSEELYILKAESTVSNANPILFEGSLTKSNSNSLPDAAFSNDYVLVYDNVGKNFKLKKLNGMIRMSKSRNETTLLNKLAKLETLNKEKVNEHNEMIALFALKTQQSIRRPKAKVRTNITQKKSRTKDGRIIIPQTIPQPEVVDKSVQHKKAKTTATSNSTKNGGKISTSKIRQSMKNKSQKPISSPLVQSFKRETSVTNSTSNSDIEEIDLDKLIDAELESDIKPNKIVQPKPTLATTGRGSKAIASKRLPMGTPSIVHNTEQESDSDLGSLVFELEEALEDDGKTNVEDEKKVTTTATTTNDDGWAEPIMDFDMDEDDFDFNDDGDSNFNIVINESPLSQNDLRAENSKKMVAKNDFKETLRESTPSGPISMKELASIRANGTGNYREASPIIPTPGLSSSATFKNQPRMANISSVATPTLADDGFQRTSLSPEDEDISEEE